MKLMVAMLHCTMTATTPNMKPFFLRFISFTANWICIVLVCVLRLKTAICLFNLFSVFPLISTKPLWLLSSPRLTIVNEKKQFVLPALKLWHICVVFVCKFSFQTFHFQCVKSEMLTLTQKALDVNVFGKNSENGFRFFFFFESKGIIANGIVHLTICDTFMWSWATQKKNPAESQLNVIVISIHFMAAQKGLLNARSQKRRRKRRRKVQKKKKECKRCARKLVEVTDDDFVITKCVHKKGVIFRCFLHLFFFPSSNDLINRTPSIGKEFQITGLRKDFDRTKKKKRAPNCKE